jgi:hypothetical protein
MEVQTFISLIEKHFGFLMREHGFTFSYSQGLGVSKDGWVIFQSRECRIMFGIDKGQFSIGVGSKYVPNSHIPQPSAIDETLMHWYHLWYLTEFLTQGPDHVSWSYPSPKWGMDDDSTIERQMVKLAKITKPYWDIVIDFFETKKFEAQVKELEAFVHEIDGVPYEKIDKI